jgi:molybdopterin-guanine dinucleotide biosynthesis protein A
VDKGLIEYRGRPLSEWTLAALAPQVDELVVSANRNLGTYAAYGHRVLPDTLPDFAGPLAGVLAALEAVNADWLLVAPCDTPKLPADLARACWPRRGRQALGGGGGRGVCNS